MIRVAAAIAMTSILLPPLGSGPAPQEADYSRSFRVFTGSGAPATLDDVVQAMEEAEAVLVGETHTDPVGHWVEAELFRRALERFRAGEEGGALRPVALSLEMFETDVQGVLDEYLQGIITEEQFKDASRPWAHYDADYRPMVEMAREKGVPVIAANAPRRYVNRVSRLGREALGDLPAWSLAFLPPLPYPQPSEAYRAEWTALMTDMPMEDQCPPPVMRDEPAPGGHVVSRDTAGAGRAMGVHVAEPSDSAGGGRPPAGMPTHMANFMENGLQAQTLWDASMAHSVTTHLDSNPGALVLHMVGGFHVENLTGIPEKIQDYRPGTRTLVVSLEMAEDFTTFDPQEHRGQGDFVILTDKSLDLNYERNCVGRAQGG